MAGSGLPEGSDSTDSGSEEGWTRFGKGTLKEMTIVSLSFVSTFNDRFGLSCDRLGFSCDRFKPDMPATFPFWVTISG